MKLTELVETLGLEVRSCSDNLFKKEVTGGYASDLLSDVIGNSRSGDLWITLQAHVNIVAVASMKELSGIILTGGREPDEDTIQKAESEKIVIMVSKLPAFELIGRLYDLGVRGVSNKTS
ncbi:MAG: hypothetical protein JW860_03860 [Sedimentisphaerales bacterium]|nr:hypothetical protein [Sedimentisphaerales bacterium]